MNSSVISASASANSNEFQPKLTATQFKNILINIRYKGIKKEHNEACCVCLETNYALSFDKDNFKCNHNMVCDDCLITRYTLTDAQTRNQYGQKIDNKNCPYCREKNYFIPNITILLASFILSHIQKQKIKYNEYIAELARRENEILKRHRTDYISNKRQNLTMIQFNAFKITMEIIKFGNFITNFRNDMRIRDDLENRDQESYNNGEAIHMFLSNLVRDNLEAYDNEYFYFTIDDNNERFDFDIFNQNETNGVFNNHDGNRDVFDANSGSFPRIFVILFDGSDIFRTEFVFRNRLETLSDITDILTDEPFEYLTNTEIFSFNEIVEYGLDHHFSSVIQNNSALEALHNLINDENQLAIPMLNFDRLAVFTFDNFLCNSMLGYENHARLEGELPNGLLLTTGNDNEDIDIFFTFTNDEDVIFTDIDVETITYEFRPIRITASPYR